MKKELLNVEFRYQYFDSIGERQHKTKTITIGIYDTLEEAVAAGNKTLETLAKTFEVRPDDKFKVKGLFGFPDRLVTNCCYPTKGVQFFAHIESLVFEDAGDDLNMHINEIFNLIKKPAKPKASEKME
jgi:hypothetical protein